MQTHFTAEGAAPTPTRRPFSAIHFLGYTPLPLTGKACKLPNWSQIKVDGTIAASWDLGKGLTPNVFNGNIGIRCGDVSDEHALIGLDIDCMDAAQAKAIEKLARDTFGLPKKYPIRYGQRPKRLIPLLAPAGATKRAVGTKGAKVEVLANGQQFVAEGIHPDTGRPYEWTEPGVIEADRLTFVTDAQLEEFLAGAASTLGVVLDATQRKAGGLPIFQTDRWSAQEEADALEALCSIDPECGRETWFRVMASWHAGTTGDGFEVFHNWSRGKYHGARPANYKSKSDCLHQWNSVQPGHIGIGTLFHIAGREDEGEAPLLEVTSFEDAWEETKDTPVQWAVKNLLTFGGAAMLVGAGKIGKSMLAYEITSLASSGGGDLFGMPDCAVAPGQVLHISLEDGKRRAAARFKALHGSKAYRHKPLLITNWPKGTHAVDAIEETLDANPGIRYVLLDTLLALTLAEGEDLEQAKRRSKGITQDQYNASVRFNSMAQERGIAMLVLHHSKKGASRESDIMDRVNGTMGMNAAYDSVWTFGHIPGADKKLKLAAFESKHRDSEHDLCCALEMREHGRWFYWGSQEDAKQTPQQRELLDMVQALYEGFKGPEDQRWVSSKNIAEATGKGRDTTLKALQRLTDKGLLTTEHGRGFKPTGAVADKAKY